MENPVEWRFQDQEERIDRLMRIVQSDDHHKLLGGALTFEDIVLFTCQNMWHLKDWVLNDPKFDPRDVGQLKTDIHAEKALLVCADLANGSKHLTLRKPKVGAALWDQQGIHLDPSKGIYREFWYVVCLDPNDPYHGMEIRDLLAAARQAWERIINKHYLSGVDLRLEMLRSEGASGQP